MSVKEVMSEIETLRNLKNDAILDLKEYYVVEEENKIRHCFANNERYFSPPFLMSSKGSFGRQNCHRCVPLTWWEQRSHNYPDTFNTTQCERYPPSFVPYC